MSWQDDELKKRIVERENNMHKAKSIADKTELKYKKMRDFLRVLIEANNKLDPILRVPDNDIMTLELKFNATYPYYLSTHIRYDINDNSLYLVEPKTVHSVFGLSDEVKKHDFIHHRITSQNMSQVIDTILKNLCQKRHLTANLPGYTMTISGSQKYEKLIKD